MRFTNFDIPANSLFIKLFFPTIHHCSNLLPHFSPRWLGWRRKDLVELWFGRSIWMISEAHAALENSLCSTPWGLSWMTTKWNLSTMARSNLTIPTDSTLPKIVSIHLFGCLARLHLHCTQHAKLHYVSNWSHWAEVYHAFKLTKVEHAIFIPQSKGPIGKIR